MNNSLLKGRLYTAPTIETLPVSLEGASCTATSITSGENFENLNWGNEYETDDLF